MSSRLRPCCCALAAGALFVLIALAGAAADETGEAQHLVVLLRGIEQEYREAFDDSGALVQPRELEEATLLLAEVRVCAERVAASDGPLGEQVAALTDAVDKRAPVDVVVARVHELSRLVRDLTGVAGEIVPPQQPSSSRGEALYREHCASCHGEHGAGDGKDAERLALRPADFTDPLFMRGETPADFFLVISLGRRRAAMPAWEEVLSVQERWDLVSYVWSLRGGAAQLAEGRALYAAHCLGCHPAEAAGAGAIAIAPGASLASLDRMAARSDGDLFRVIEDGVEGSEMKGTDVSEVEGWKLVTFTRSLSLGAPAAVDLRAALADPSVRLERALARVAQQVDAAVNAYRLREDEAGALAASAYLDFEPLEPGIAAGDPALVYRVEAEFVRLQRALRKADAIREVEEIVASLKNALDAIRPAVRPAGGARLAWIGFGIAICGAIVVLVIALRRGSWT